MAPHALLGAILLFRCVYYLAPLSLAAIALAIHEANMQQVRIERARDTAADWLAENPQVGLKTTRILRDVASLA